MPSRRELDEAIMAPARLRLVPKYLHEGSVVKITQGALGKRYEIPCAFGGSYAVVYKFRLPSGQYKAIRCFYTDVGPEMQQRYQRLNHLLPNHASGFTIGFKYEQQGIKLPSEDGQLRTYPMVVMDWVEGRELLKEIGHLSEKKDVGQLRQLVQKWVNLIFAMKQIPMAHGDLSGGNVMVRPNGNLVLVDYDGVYLPDSELEKCVPGERGNPDYQHPAHQQHRKYNERMDDFSALVIYLAILALCERPELFRKYVHHNDRGEVVGENLLFQEEDFRNPDRPDGVIRDLETNSRDPEVRRLTQILKEACKRPIQDVPDFRTVVDPYLPLRELVQCTPRDWRKIVEYAGYAPKPLPPDLGPIVAEAEKYVQALDELQKAIHLRRAVAIKRVYEQQKARLSNWDQILNDWPEGASALKKTKQAIDQVKSHEALQKAPPHDRGPNGLVQIWPRYSGILQGCAEGEYWEKEVKSWARRNAACEKFLQVLQKNPCSDIAVAEAWEELQKAGGHPDAQRYESIARLSLQRGHCLSRIRQIQDKNDEPSDREWVRIWDDGLLGPCHDAIPFRSRWLEAKRRVEIVENIHRAVLQVEQGRAEEEEIVRVAQGLSAGYRFRLADRLETAKERVKARDAFYVAWHANPRSDLKLADAWEAWQKAGGRISVSPQERQEAETAVQRARRLRAIMKVMAQDTHDETADRNMLSHWDEALLANSPDAKPYLPRIRLAQDRIPKLDSLRKAIQRVDAIRKRKQPVQRIEDGEAAIAAAADALDDLDKNYIRRSCSQEQLERIAQARRRAECTKKLAAAISEDSDRQIARCWRELQNAGGDPAAEPWRDRAEKAKWRSKGLERFKDALDANLPIDKKYQRIVQLWDEYQLDESKDACSSQHNGRPYSELVNSAREWLDLSQEFQKAVQDNDVWKIAEIGTTPPFKDYLLSPYKEKIDNAVKVVGEVKELLQCIEQNDDRRFAECYRDRILWNLWKFRSDLYLKNSSRIRRLIEQHLFCTYRFDFFDGPHRNPMLLDAGTKVRVHWRWPEIGKITKCCIVACWDREIVRLPDTGDEVRGISMLERTQEDYDRSFSSAELPLRGSGRRLYVTVWPLVPLPDGEELVGPPLRFPPVEHSPLNGAVPPSIFRTIKVAKERIGRLLES